LGKNIAETFAQGFDAVLLENHGVVTVGPDLLTAFQRLETLDFCARTEIHARGLGQVNSLTAAQIAEYEQRQSDLPPLENPHHTSRELELRDDICNLVHRAYDQRLMTSTEGTVSTRVSGDSFLITPYNVDRKYLEIEDVVLVENGRAEAGKLPSRAAKLHATIYANHPDIHCIITAQTPNAMAYSVTNCPLDTKTIPESYVVIRDVPRVPYGILHRQPEKVSAMLSNTVSVVIVENDTILATGGSLHQAFDRLEVADFTAASLINTLNLGPLVPSGEAEIKDLRRAFFGSAE
jgi:L-fuculose-phosphate aldolase